MSQKITLSKAIEMTSRYRSQRESILLPEFRGLGLLPVCETIDRSDVALVLAQTDCTGLRIYYGMYEDQTVHAVLVGVNAMNEDILPAGTLTAQAEEEGEIINDGYRCPPVCPPDSPLNS